jgi:hypothetical protein
MRLLIVVCAFAFTLFGCEGRKNLELRDGFTVTRIYGDAHAIGKPNGRLLIMPNVVDAIDDEDYLVGLRKKSDPEFKTPKGREDQLYGYFIYDKKTKELDLGLSYDEYLIASKEKGINLKLSKK